MKSLLRAADAIGTCSDWETELGRIEDGVFADGGPLVELPGSAERKTGTAARERPTEVTPGYNEYPGLEFRMSRSSSHGLGKYSASHALRHRWRVAAGCAADSLAPTCYGLPGKQGIREGGLASAGRRDRVGQSVQDRRASCRTNKSRFRE